MFFSEDEITFTGIKASASTIKNLTGANSGGTPDLGMAQTGHTEIVLSIVHFYDGE
jgi:hypothetical protein